MSNQQNQLTGIPPPLYVRELNTNDVLQGRGAASDRFEGNIRFRALVSERRAEYRSTSQQEAKARVALEIIQMVQAVGGRFLRKVDSISEAETLGIPPGQQGWLPIGESKTLEKVKQALRDRREEVNQSPSTTRKTVSSVATVTAASGNSALCGRTAPGLSPMAQTNMTGHQLPDRNFPSSAIPPCHPLDMSYHNLVAGSFPLRGLHQYPRDCVHWQPVQSAHSPSIHPPHLNQQSHRNELVTLPDREVEPPRVFQSQSAGPPQNAMYHAFMQVQREQNLEQQLATILAGDPRHTTPSELFAAHRIAAAWRDIPETYASLFPLEQQPGGPHFTSKDLQILLVTVALAESTKDVSCLGRLQLVLCRILNLPSPRLRLDSTEKHNLATATQNLAAMLRDGR